MSAVVEPSGECLRGEGLVWLIGVVMCSLAAYRGSNCGGVIIPTPFWTFGNDLLYRARIAFLWGATAISKNEV